ncbi:MAG: type VI secretion system tip protein VgrG [Cyanobium sp.]
MPVLPAINAGSPISARVLVDGKTIPDDHPLMSVDIWLAVNKVARARLVIADIARDDIMFPISVSSTYIPGAKVVIELGYNDQTTPIFSGLIITHGLDMGSDDAAQLVVELADPAMGLTLARHTSVFTECSDSEVIEKLIRDQGLKAEVTGTSEKHPSLVQYACSNWDFLIMRAEVNGMVVTNSDGIVRVAPPNTKATEDLELEYGVSIRQGQLTIDATTQVDPSVLQGRAWDPGSQKVAEGAKPNADVNELGNLQSQDLAKVFAINASPNQTAANLQSSDLSSWSKAELMRMRLAKVRGQLRCAGSGAARPGSMVALKGFGERFNGKAIVSGVHHQLTASEWSTELEIGLDPEAFAASTPHISPPAAAGQLAGVSQLQIGIVDKPADDPDGLMRLPIRLPLAANQTQPLWARLASPYATAGAGIQFRPEQDDEVIVAFMDNDPRFPVVIGSLYSKLKAPPSPIKKENSLKYLMSKSKLQITFEEEKKVIEISTPARQLICLSDEDKQIVVSDANGNTITLSSSGINLVSKGDINLSADGAIVLDAKTKLSLKGAAGSTLKGSKVEIDADTSLTAKGNAETKISSPANVVIQGTLVRIN